MRSTKNKITGIVIPTDWDDAGSITAVAVSTPVENILLHGRAIDDSELLNLVHKEVEFIGIVKGKDTYQKIMLVDQYQLKKSWR